MADVRRGLSQGEVVIGTVLANRMGKKVGDEIELNTPKGMKKVRIAGIATVYLYRRHGRLYGRPAGQGNDGRRGSRHVHRHGRTEKIAIGRSRNEKTLQRTRIDFAFFRRPAQKLNAKLDGVIGSLWGLMGLGFIMGALGMANTLTMNVLEQTRELALLRVVAMTRRQVRKTILAQAAIIGVIGLFTGTLGGMVGSYTINLSSIPLFGHAADFAMHPLLVAVMLWHRHGDHSSAAWIPAERPRG